jgi:hypothetical protein
MKKSKKDIRSIIKPIGAKIDAEGSNKMKFYETIKNSGQDAHRLETLYQEALQNKEENEFREDMLTCYQEAPDNLLFAAWFYRLGPTTVEMRKEKNRNWKLAMPLSVITGLIFWALSSNDLLIHHQLPFIFLFWAPIASLAALAFLALTAGKEYRRIALVAGGLAAACIYVFTLATGQAEEFQKTYLTLMAIHLPLLCWIAIGISLLGLGSKPENRFAFLIKSIEVMITAGLYLIAGMAFGGITYGLFAALNLQIPELLTRLAYAGGFGLLPVLAVASVYEPTLSPREQDFSQGLSKLVATMMRLLLPLTLVVLVIYIIAIPFSFMEPFKNREVLIVYNVMLFAIMGLLIGATPVTSKDLSPKMNTALRYGVLAVAGLTVLVSLYALTATVYRTVLGGITINRITIIGWNGINISILVLLIYRLISEKETDWAERVKAVLSLGTVAYGVWTVFLIVGIPILFR